MITKLIESEDDLCMLLERIKRACSNARPGVLFEEFTIIRRLPGPRPPYVQFIQGVMPEGYNPFFDTWKGGNRAKQKAAKRKRRKSTRRNRQA